MASYYYLISSLPTLSADECVITYDKFLSMCKSTVNSAVYKQLCSLSLNDMDSFKGCELVRLFGSFYKKFRDELSYQRNVKLGKEAVRSSYADSDTIAYVNSAMNAKNPLEAENLLLKAQFEYADSLCRMHYFDDYVLFAYALKIRLLERKLVFEHDNGLTEFNRLFDGIQKQINNI